MKIQNYGCVLCSVPRLFVYLRMQMSTSKQYYGPRSAFEPGYLRVAPVLRLHLCAFRLYLARYLCGFQTTNKTKKNDTKCENERKRTKMIGSNKTHSIRSIQLPKSTTNIQIHHFKTTSMCPRSIAQVVRPRASVLPCYRTPPVCVPDVICLVEC